MQGDLEEREAEDPLVDFQLGPFRVQPSLNRLTGEFGCVRVEPKLMDVLRFLAGRAGRVVSKEEIVEAVWPEVYVTDSVITRAIAGLRRALEDDARSPRFIETIAKRGYRLLVSPAEAGTDDSGGRVVEETGDRGPALPSRPPLALQPAASPRGAASGRSGVRDPFVIGQWVRGERFFGREAEIREVLHGPRNGLWVLGSRAVGKTSLLKHLELLTEDGREGYFPLFWDLQGSVEEEDFHRDFAAALADAEERLDRAGISLEEVGTAEFFDSLGRLRRALRPKGLTLLLLWDEVEELIHLHEQWPVLLRKLRRALQSQEGIRTVLASGPRLWHLGEQRDETSPFLHGFAPPLYLGPLDEGAASALLRQGEGARLDEATVSELHRRSGSHPSLLQLLSRRFLETGDLGAATEAVLADLTVRYFFAVDFDLLTPLEKELLEALAAEEKPAAVEELALSGAPDLEIASRLQHLERLGQVLRHDDGRREVAGTIRRDWLRQRTAGRA
ncbi:MAG: helix-turn-helix transcriptional regulator [Acidobacteria bacterium]|nr:helix-turn-helix transcriptional regulator [Acidobacteriota bacterium]